MSKSPFTRPILVFLFLLSFSIYALTVFANSVPVNKPAANAAYFSSQFENIMGTSFELRVKTSSSRKAAWAEKIALQEVNRLSAILSAYDANSEFSRWLRTKGEAVKASPELIEVLQLFDAWRSRTRGALDPAAEVTSRLWKQAAARQQVPTEQERANAVQQTAQQHWYIDPVQQTITHTSDAPLMLNTFVKSYVMDKTASKVMALTGINDVLINVGGDILTRGDANTISIADPLSHALNDVPMDVVKVSNGFVATSGNYHRGQLVQGKWYSHIVDPRTALPVDEVIAATVIAPNATDAGALATAFNVLSVSESKALAAQYPSAAYLIVTRNGEKIQSSNWTSVQESPVTPVSLSTPIADQWDPKFELLVNLELAQIQGPYRRPFIAIWIEDKDKQSVRTVTVWYNKPRWLRDLRAWYSANYSKFNAESGTISAVSSATRSAGKYAIKWDGKDDKGDYVPAGNYTVKIEVVREHGSYQLYTQPITVNNKAAKFELTPNTEVSSASIEIKKS